MKKLNKYQQFLILEKFDDNFKAELQRLGITDPDEINKYLYYAHRGHLAEYLQSQGTTMKFGMLLALFKDAQVAKKKNRFKSRCCKSFT